MGFRTARLVNPIPRSDAHILYLLLKHLLLALILKRPQNTLTIFLNMTYLTVQTNIKLRPARHTRDFFAIKSTNFYNITEVSIGGVDARELESLPAFFV